MNFATAFHSGDKDQAARLFLWIRELEWTGRHKLFVIPAKGQKADFTDAPPFEVINDHEGIVCDWSGTGAVRDAAGANSMLRQLAWAFYLKKLGPWFFLEPDCIPLVPEWADKIDDEYKRAGKLFMGSRVPGKPGEYDDHSTGNMVLPQDAAVLSQNLMLPRHSNIAGRTVEVAFDVAGAVDVLANYYDTPLLQHVFRGPEFETEADLARIRPDAVLFHTAKGPGLIRLLREKRFGTRHGAAARCADGVTLSPSETPRTKVFTYFAPVTSAEGQTEQNDLLQLWDKSWRNIGFDPVILTEKDAAKHPRFTEWKAKFETLPTVNPKVYEMSAWTRWIAMAQGGGGLMTDYDTICFSEWEFQSMDYEQFPLILGDHVPCAVVGTAEQYTAAIEAFLTCSYGAEQGRPHQSDMLAAIALGFKSLGVCKEYKAPGWETADMVHFSHASCKPEKRSAVMARGRPAPEVTVTVGSSNGTSETWIGQLRGHLAPVQAMCDSDARKARLRDELRKLQLLGPGKKRR